jgi:hypothetical protein
MNVSRENLDLQRALQVVAQATDNTEVQVAFLPGKRSVLPGYVAYRGYPVVDFRITSESWPDRSILGDEESVPEACIGVAEPRRAEQGEPVFSPLEKYLQSFNPNEYHQTPNENGYLPLKTPGS